MADGELKETLESDKLLSQIEAAKTGDQSAQSPVETPKESTEDKTAPSDKAGQAVSQDIKDEAPETKVSDKPKDDVREWAKKKGIRDEESALRSLRQLERKMHKMTFEEKAKDVPRGTMPYQPQPQWNQPVYQPPPPPQPVYPYQMDREKILEQEAKRYNMAPEDFERVLNLTNDLYAVKERQLRAQYDSRLSEIDKETRRNSEIRELMQDPLFTNPKVQFEMHKVLEDNPAAFTHEPAPYLYAFNEAQRRLARQYLQDGEVVTEEKGSLPNQPPKEGSRGSGVVHGVNKESQIMDSFSKAKTSDEQREILSRLGAVPTL